MDRKKFAKRLGERITELRKGKGLTQIELADRIFKERQDINRIEKGGFLVNTYTVFQLAQALEISMDELFDFDMD